MTLLNTMGFYTETRLVNLGDKFSPKRAGAKTSHVVFILDASTSMNSIKNKTVNSFNEFLASHKNSEIPTYISLYTFANGSVTPIYEHIPANSAQELTINSFQCNGMTNLLDAIGNIMERINQLLRMVNKDSRDSIILTILTDGEENYSKQYSIKDIKTMVTKAEQKNWGIIFLGANIDTYAVGRSLGITDSVTLPFSVNKIDSSIASVSSLTNRLKRSYFDGESTTVAYASSGFTDKEKESSV